jgi:hypothetical protein
LQTTLTPPQEAVAVALRKALLLPLDDLLAVVREFPDPRITIPARGMSRPHLRGLKHDRTRSLAQKVRENPCIEGGIQTCMPIHKIAQTDVERQHVSRGAIHRISS